MTNEVPRVAFFPDSYLDINGAAMTCRKLTGFAKANGYPLLCVYADKKTQKTTDGSIINLGLKRSMASIPFNEELKYDPFFSRYLRLVARTLDEFKPDVVHLTGVNDVSITAAILAHRRKIPLLGSWHTNLHEFAARRLDKIFSFLPADWRSGISGLAENLILKGSFLYYQMPRVVLAPNQELVDQIKTHSGREAFLMGRGVDSDVYSPAKRTVDDGILRLGFVGRLRAEKNVRLLVDLEKELLRLGRSNFKFLIVGDGDEQEYLENNLENAEFTGFLVGAELAEAYANMDIFVFPSETETFGNVTQEALCSGVPAIVSNLGGSKFIVKDNVTGHIAKSLPDFVKFTVDLMDNPEKLEKMKLASRDYVMANSWDAVFERVYKAYERAIELAGEPRQG